MKEWYKRWFQKPMIPCYGDWDLLVEEDKIDVQSKSTGGLRAFNAKMGMKGWLLAAVLVAIIVICVFTGMASFAKDKGWWVLKYKGEVSYNGPDRPYAIHRRQSGDMLLGSKYYETKGRNCNYKGEPQKRRHWNDLYYPECLLGNTGWEGRMEMVYVSTIIAWTFAMCCSILLPTYIVFHLRDITYRHFTTVVNIAMTLTCVFSFFGWTIFCWLGIAAADFKLITSNEEDYVYDFHLKDGKPAVMWYFSFFSFLLSFMGLVLLYFANRVGYEIVDGDFDELRESGSPGDEEAGPEVPLGDDDEDDAGLKLDHDALHDDDVDDDETDFKMENAKPSLLD